MRATWELEDGRRLDAKAVKTGEWSVRVNAIQLPNTVKTLGFLECDVTFDIAPDLRAMITVRRQRHGLELNLHIGGQVFLYPGHRPFRCPACRRAQRTCERTCSQCHAPLPNRAQRLQELRREMLFRNMRGVALVMLFVSGLSVASTVKDPRVAMARLQATRPSFTPEQLRDFAVASAWSNFTEVAVIAAVTVCLAFLSRRAPVAASVMYIAMWIAQGVFIAFADMKFKAFAMLFTFLLIGGGYQLLRVALEIRAASNDANPSRRARTGTAP